MAVSEDGWTLLSAGRDKAGFLCYNKDVFCMNIFYIFFISVL